MADLLVEIGTEEIPDWMIEPALADWRAKFQAAFGVFGGSAIEMDATPRRLIMRVRDLQTQAPDAETVVFGPYLSAGVKAAEGFARKWNAPLDQLSKTTDAKGERYVFHQRNKGQTAHTALEEKLGAVIASIAFPKTMSWPGSGGVRFIRPIRWIVALFDEEVLNFELAGVKAGNHTRGHRVLGSKAPIKISIADYERVLKQNGVIVVAREREHRIRAALGKRVERDDELVATLVYLTEFPSVIRGRFDDSYLSLPKEILVTVMRHHQRYFSVLKDDGSLAAEFVAVTNTAGDPDGLIRQGNERVLRARFNDARFFWVSDQKKPLVDRVSDLAKVTFQAKLGSYQEKTNRVVALAQRLAREIAADLDTVKRAALLLKCDLTTDMVKEFPELQGVVGGLYARAQSETAAVADAIYDQYKPVSMEDTIPRSREAQLVAVADKLDTLRECFRIGLIPTGSRDPFALRRAAQGIVKILFEARLALPIMELVADVNGLADFLRERVQFYLRDVLGFAYDEVNAVLAAGVTTFGDVVDRVRAVHGIRPTEDFEPVAASFKRIQNILKQASVSEAAAIDENRLKTGPERDLYDAFQGVRTKVGSGSDYRARLEAMASLRPQVDCFFDKILVNDADPAIRQNRLALLYSLLTEFSTIADFSEIVTQRGSGIAV